MLALLAVLTATLDANTTTQDVLSTWTDFDALEAIVDDALLHRDPSSGCARVDNSWVNALQHTMVSIQFYLDYLQVDIVSVLLGMVAFAFFGTCGFCFCCFCFNGCCGRHKTYQKTINGIKSLNPLVDLLENRVVSRTATIWIFLFAFLMVSTVLIGNTLLVSPHSYFPDRLDPATPVRGVQQLCKSPLGEIVEAGSPTLFNTSSPLSWILADGVLYSLLQRTHYNCSENVVDGEMVARASGLHALPRVAFHAHDLHLRGLAHRTAHAALLSYAPDYMQRDDAAAHYDECAAWGAQLVHGPHGGLRGDTEVTSDAYGTLAFDDLLLERADCAGSYTLLVSCEGASTRVVVRTHTAALVASLDLQTIQLQWVGS